MNIPGLARALRELARVPSRMAREGADAITARMQSQFDGGHDPYGATHKALKSGAPSFLDDSGAMRGMTKATPMSGAGIALESPSPANFHQAGTRRGLPARPVLPAKGLPATWRADLQAIYSRMIGEGLR